MNAYQAAGGRPPLRRRKFLIHKPSQLRLMAAMLVAVLAIEIVSVFALYGSLQGVIENAMFSSHIRINTLGEVMTPIIMRVNAWSAMAILIISAVIVGSVVYRMNRTLRLVRADVRKLGELDISHAGEYKRAESVRSMMEAFDEMTETLSAAMAKVKTSSAEMEKGFSGEDGVDIEKMKKNVRELKEALEFFD